MSNKDSFSAQDVENLALLANLPLSAEQKTKFSSQLSNILSFFGKLQGVDTEGIAPFLGVKSSKPFRADETSTSLEKNDALVNSTTTDKGLFVVKNIFEND